MNCSSRRAANRWSEGTILMLAAILPLTACSDDDDPAPAPDTTAPALSATPGSQVFNGASLQVSLSAADARDASPTIYYTLDATFPDPATSPVYSTPLTLTATTVLRAIAVDDAGNVSPMLLRGYTQVTNQWAAGWATSGHGDILGEPFRHWDEDGDVSTSCAKCHTPTGFVDYIEDGTVDARAPLPLGHSCDACHETPPFTRFENLVAHPELEHVVFPSAEEASTFSDGNMCITCHQGRSSTVQVNAAIAANPGGTYGFINIHYYAAGATLFGAETLGAYQYDGMEYAGRNIFASHEPNQTSCIGCHMRGVSDHSFLPQVSDCTSCHMGNSFETLSGSPVRHHTAISTLEGELYTMIQSYARGTIGMPIVYSSASYPYWFNDLDNDGFPDPNEVASSNRYQDMDEHLLKAAYNYQTVLKDPAGYIHNGAYLHQILHDSIVDLGGTPSIPAPGRAGWDRENASKTQQWHISGHARSTGEPFRHWDEEGEVPTSCARCHTQAGFVDFVADGTVNDPHTPDLVGCIACHDDTNLFANAETRHDNLVANTALEPVTFPSGATATLGGPSNICMTCHQGRESGLSVENNAPNSVVQAPIDYDSFDFVNRHYYAAGAIFFGGDVTAGAQYAGRTYKGENTYAAAHDIPGKRTCVGCHMRGTADHVFLPEPDDCATCHVVVDFALLGLPFNMLNVDYDGDMVGESFQQEIDGQAENLYVAIQLYARTQLAQPSPIIYSGSSYPYWFKDSDGDGMVSPGEATFSNRYRDFDRKLLKAAFNYHSAQDPASDMHNYQYVLQTLYDSMDDLDDGAQNSSAPGTRP